MHLTKEYLFGEPLNSKQTKKILAKKSQEDKKALNIHKSLNQVSISCNDL